MRPRVEMEKDLLSWAEKGSQKDYNDLVIRLILETVLDMREQNAVMLQVMSGLRMTMHKEAKGKRNA